MDIAYGRKNDVDKRCLQLCVRLKGLTHEGTMKISYSSTINNHIQSSRKKSIKQDDIWMKLNHIIQRRRRQIK